DPGRPRHRRLRRPWLGSRQAHHPRLRHGEPDRRRGAVRALHRRRARLRLRAGRDHDPRPDRGVPVHQPAAAVAGAHPLLRQGAPLERAGPGDAGTLAARLRWAGPGGRGAGGAAGRRRSDPGRVRRGGAPMSSTFAQFGNSLHSGHRSLPIVRRRRTWYLLSVVVLVLLSAVGLLRGPNLGIEFTGGSEFQVAGVSEPDRSIAREIVRGQVPGNEPNVTVLGQSTVRVQTEQLDSTETAEL